MKREPQWMKLMGVIGGHEVRVEEFNTTHGQMRS